LYCKSQYSQVFHVVAGIALFSGSRRLTITNNDEAVFSDIWVLTKTQGLEHDSPDFRANQEVDFGDKMGTKSAMQGPFACHPSRCKSRPKYF
jgi:hypothetical protein